MHQIRFRLGIRPRPRWGAYNAPQTFSLYLRGLLLRQGTGWVGNNRTGGRGEGRRWEEREEKGTHKCGVHTPCPKSWKYRLQNWSDWWGRQHRHLPRAGNTLALLLAPLRYHYTVSKKRHGIQHDWKGETTNHHLIAQSLRSNSAKNYQNRLMCVEVIVCNVSVVFWDTV